MSSERDESAELLDELSVKSDAEKSGSPPPKKAHGDHAKPKRRGRRGKKRKQRKDSGGAACESENQESEVHPEPERAGRESPTWDSDEDLGCEINAYNDVIIRPINVPSAPENSTQFIIDDHNECRLYMSFETPNPYLSSSAQQTDGEGNHMIIEPIGEDAAYIDIDYEYESPGDFDNSAYYDREFELSYKSNRFDELLRLPRSQLISGLQALEARLKELSDDLLKENPSPILEKLQAELLELQEKHFQLKESNSRLVAQLDEQGRSSAVSAEESQAIASEQQSAASPKSEKQSDYSVDECVNADPVLVSTSEMEDREDSILQASH